MNKDKLDKKFLHNYFSKEDTISNWWEPEKKTRQKVLYVKQRQDIFEYISPSNKLILDAGTGKGRFAIQFAQMGAKKVVGIDINRGMLSEAKQRAESARVDDKVVLEIGDVQKLKYADNSFDIVCAMEILVHLPNPKDFMNELSRVCKPGGEVIISATNRGFLWQFRYRPYLFLREIGRKVCLSRVGKPLLWLVEMIRRNPVPKRPPIAQTFSKKELIDLANNTGLEIKEIMTYGQPTALFTIICQKPGGDQGYEGS